MKTAYMAPSRRKVHETKNFEHYKSIPKDIFYEEYLIIFNGQNGSKPGYFKTLT